MIVICDVCIAADVKDCALSFIAEGSQELELGDCARKMNVDGCERVGWEDGPR